MREGIGTCVVVVFEYSRWRSKAWDAVLDVGI